MDSNFIQYLRNKVANPVGPCLASQYSWEELRALSVVCKADPSLYRKVLAQLSPQRNPECRAEAENKFKAVVNACQTFTKATSPLKITNFLSPFWSKTLEYTDAFMRENATKQCEYKDYSLNTARYVQYQKILQAHISYFRNLGLRPLADYYRYYQHLRYIPFKEFYQRLLRATQDLLKHIRALRKKSSVIVIFRLAYEIQKSSLWVARLVYPLLRPELDGVDCFQTSQSKHYQYLRERKGVDRVILIYPDDCIYSGQQFHVTVSNDYYELKQVSNAVEFYSLCPYVTSTFLNSSMYRAIKVNLGTFETLVGVSEETKTRTQMYNNILQYLASEERMPNLLQAFGVKEKKDIMSLELEKTWKPRLEIEAKLNQFIDFREETGGALNFYFQHKLADQVSIVTSLFVYGLVPGGKLGSLINSCPYEEKFKYLGLDFLLEKYRCPPSCYKQLQYTWQGQAIPPRKFLSDVFFPENVQCVIS